MAHPQTHGKAYDVECPTCGAPAGQSCLVLRAALRDGVRVWCHPHVDRIMAVVQRDCGSATCDISTVRTVSWRSRDLATGVSRQRQIWVCATHDQLVTENRFYNPTERSR